MKLIESLSVLSLSYSDQKIRFPSFVDVPFEILDDFDNAFLSLPALIENGKFTKQEIAYIVRLHNLINITASNPLLKNLEPEQFDASQEWNMIRDLAKKTLELINRNKESVNE